MQRRRRGGAVEEERAHLVGIGLAIAVGVGRPEHGLVQAKRELVEARTIDLGRPHRGHGALRTSTGHERERDGRADEESTSRRHGARF